MICWYCTSMLGSQASAAYTAEVPARQLCRCCFRAWARRLALRLRSRWGAAGGLLSGAARDRVVAASRCSSAQAMAACPLNCCPAAGDCQVRAVIHSSHSAGYTGHSAHCRSTPSRHSRFCNAESPWRPFAATADKHCNRQQCDLSRHAQTVLEFPTIGCSQRCMSDLPCTSGSTPASPHEHLFSCSAAQNHQSQPRHQAAGHPPGSACCSSSSCTMAA